MFFTLEACCVWYPNSYFEPFSERNSLSKKRDVS